MQPASGAVPATVTVLSVALPLTTSQTIPNCIMLAADNGMMNSPTKSKDHDGPQQGV
jgi:hypothetical protein